MTGRIVSDGCVAGPVQTEIVSTPPTNWVANDRSGLGAGPVRTEPLVLKWDPWHGQTNSWFAKPVIVHA